MTMQYAGHTAATVKNGEDSKTACPAARLKKIEWSERHEHAVPASLLNVET